MKVTWQFVVLAAFLIAAPLLSGAVFSRYLTAMTGAAIAMVALLSFLAPGNLGLIVYCVPLWALMGAIGLKLVRIRERRAMAKTPLQT